MHAFIQTLCPDCIIHKEENYTKGLGGFHIVLCGIIFHRDNWVKPRNTWLRCMVHTLAARWHSEAVANSFNRGPGLCDSFSVVLGTESENVMGCKVFKHFKQCTL